MKRLNSLKSTDILTVRDAFEKYQKYNSRRNLSPYTLIHKENNMKLFYIFIDDDDFLIKDVDNDIVNEFNNYLQDREIKPVSVNTYLRSIRAFLNWCSDNNYMNPVKITMLKVDDEIKETYSEEQLKILLEKPDVKKCSFAVYRAWTMINYLISTGNRLNTIINIKIEDLDIENEMLTIKKAKNRKQQIIPLSHTLCNILEEYLSYRQGNPEDYLFCNIYGQQLTKGAFEKAIVRYNIDRGVNITSIHSFRHSFAKYFVKNGGDAFRLQKLMGHSNISTTKIYVNLFADDIKENYEKFNPLDVIINQNNRKPISLKR